MINSAELVIAELVISLSFYADPENYLSSSSGFAAQYDPDPSPVMRDKGKEARSTLDKLKKGKP